MENIHKTDILILGAGIGGYETYRNLQKQLKRKKKSKKITIVDKNNYFTFVPLLHEIASGAVNPNHATIPIREFVYKTPHEFIKTEVEKIKPEQKVAQTSKGQIQYETCIVAMGSVINFCDIKGAKENTHHVRTLEDSLKLKTSLIEQMENKGKVSVNIVGGGYSGVEIAAEIGQLKLKDFKKLYPEVEIKINLIELEETILPRMQEKVQNKITKRLEKLKINIQTDASVKEVTEQEVLLGNETKLKNDITVWATGFKTNAGAMLPEEYLEKGRIKVNNYLQSKKNKNIYALGDIALINNSEDSKECPQLGEAAHNEGIYLGKNLLDIQKNRNVDKFKFKSKGRLMPVGEWYGVAVFGWLNNFTLFGRFAWWLRRTAYVLFMPGIIRKIKLITNWTLKPFGFRNLIDIEPLKKK